MNKERRKWIQEILTKLESVKKELSDVLEEEEEYFNTMPEGFQSGQRGEAAQTAINSLDSAVSQIEDALDSLGEIE